jgi:glycosyltransferase involved in cell wall biosynthesis
MRSIKLSNTDRVIALKFPAYLIRHPHKTIWLIHQFRQVYDLKQALVGPVKHLRNTLARGLDRLAFAEAKNIFSISPVVQKRLKKFSGTSSEVLTPPINNPEMFPGGEPKGYIFVGGRINRSKRQSLLLQALALCSDQVRVVLAGPPDTEADREALLADIERLGIGPDKLTHDLRFLSRQEYANYINASNASAYIPADEDAYGYVTTESALAGKPIITTTDSGGVQMFVRDRIEGYVSRPNPQDLSKSLEAVFRDPEVAKAMGKRAKLRTEELVPSWDAVITRLLR